MMSEIFWTAFISTVCGVILISVKLCYKSKCKEIDFCCLKIVRDVEGEEKIDRIESKDSSNKQ